MDVGKALRNTSKGRLKYDKYWVEEGRTQEVLDNISKYSTKVAINVSPKVLSQVIAATNHEESKEEESKTVSSSNSNVKSPKKASDKCKYSDTIFYELQTETDLPILEYEEERLKCILEVFKAKKDEFEKFSSNLEQQTELQYHLSKRNIELDEKRKAADLKKIEDAVIEEVKEEELLMKQKHQTEADSFKLLSAIMLEAEMNQKKAEEELKKRQQEQEEFILQLNSCLEESERSLIKAQDKLKSCEHPSFLKVPVNDRISQMTEFVQKIKITSDRAQLQPLTIEDIYNANDLVKKSYVILQDITNDIEHAKVKALQDHEKKQQQLKETAMNESTRISKSESGSTEFVETKANDQDKNLHRKDETKNKLKNEAKEIISGFIAPDIVEEYHKISENLKSVQNSIKGFVDDPRNKKLRFELQKSINVPINAISSISGAHVRDKISRLLSILNAKTLSKDSPNETIIYNFCANLIARKFVEQGDKQISAQHSTAFPIALAVVGVWIKKPDVGSLILGHFYLNCPYLVPYYPPRAENQSNQEYYESLGYCFDKDGKMEEKYKFLNRMSGFMRLYAAIILSPVPPSSTEYPHPHGITHGWSWISRVLNMDPRPDITATLLYDFLDVTGHALQKTYGKQFKKLLHIICKDFFQKIKQVTPSGSGGPVERLETFLQQTVKKGYIPPPEGILGPEFWSR